MSDNPEFCNKSTKYNLITNNAKTLYDYGIYWTKSLLFLTTLGTLYQKY